eukprot:9681809-Ditylum_brightwellii.AAC.1
MVQPVNYFPIRLGSILQHAHGSCCALFNKMDKNPVPMWYLRHSNITTHIDAMKENHGGECHKSTAMTLHVANPCLEECDVTGKEPVLGHEKPPMN